MRIHDTRARRNPVVSAVTIAAGVAAAVSGTLVAPATFATAASAPPQYVALGDSTTAIGDGAAVAEPAGCLPFLRTTQEQLEGAMARAAETAGAEFVSRLAATAAHSPCSLGAAGSWIEPFTVAPATSGSGESAFSVDPRSLHPNAAGTKATAGAVAAALRTTPASSATPEWNSVGAYRAGDIVRVGDRIYRALQSYTGYGDGDWINAPALWTRIG